MIKQWIKQQVCFHRTVPQIIIKAFLRSLLCLVRHLAHQIHYIPLQRVNRSGNICEASHFESINRRGSSVKQRSYDALISLWSASPTLSLSLFQHKHTEQIWGGNVKDKIFFLHSNNAFLFFFSFLCLFKPVFLKRFVVCICSLVSERSTSRNQKC